MNRLVIFRIVGICMALHFCAVSTYSFVNESIAIEAESDTDEENKDNKKEQKITTIHLTYQKIQNLKTNRNFDETNLNWIPPHIEISSPPPKLT